MTLFDSLRKSVRLKPRQWSDLVRATIELAIANRRLKSRSASELLGAVRSEPVTARSLTEAQRGLVARIAFAVPRAGARTPWRADCLIQALAAQRWLASRGIASDICIGVRKEAEFAAHAWLKVGDEVVTGGDIPGYVPLIESRVLDASLQPR